MYYCLYLIDLGQQIAGIRINQLLKSHKVNYSFRFIEYAIAYIQLSAKSILKLDFTVLAGTIASYSVTIARVSYKREVIRLEYCGS